MSIVRRSVCALAWLTAITVALSAAIPSAGAASQKPRSGGTATFLVSGDAVSLDNVRLTAPGGTGSNTAALFVYNSLVTIDPITNKPMMRLAQSLKSSPDAKVWTLKLRAGLTFSDGTPLDAAAVVVNWDRHKIPALASTCSTTVANLGTYAAQDATTVVVTLPQARVGFPVLLGQCLGQIQSPTAVAKYGATYGSTPESVVGAGPYVVKDWVRGSQMTLTRNPNYWDKPRPYIDTMVLKPVTDAAQKLSAFQVGQADFAYFVSLDEQVAGLKAQGATLYGYPPAGGGADVAFNQSVPGLDDVRIRRALVLATDPADLNVKAAGGASKMVDTFFVKGSAHYNANVRQKSNDLKEAQKLVDEYTAEHGPLTLTFTLADSLTAWGTAQVQQWNRLNGLTIELEVVPAIQTNTRLTLGNWQMAVTALAGADPETLYNIMYSTGRGNVIHYNNPKVDAALTQLLGETNPAKQQELYTTISKAFLDDAAVVYWYRVLLPVAISSKVAGVVPFNNSQPDYTKLWLKS